MKFIIVGILLGLLVGLLGIPLNNYEINKCKIIEANDYYEAVSGCYMPLYLPNWNLFWNVVGMSIVGMFLMGFGGFIVEMFLEDF